MITQIVDMHTEHLSPLTWYSLTRAAPLASLTPGGWRNHIAVAAHPEGAFITVPDMDDDGTLEAVQDAPSDLFATLMYAHVNRCATIAFVPDGGIVPQLNLYRHV